jgi:hypothetical protein
MPPGVFPGTTSSFATASDSGSDEVALLDDVFASDSEVYGNVEENEDEEDDFDVNSDYADAVDSLFADLLDETL